MTVWFLTLLAIALAATHLARRYALARGIVDEPGERRSHVVRTPRGGGVAIVLVMLVAAVRVAWPQMEGTSLVAAVFAAGLLVIALIGWMDDHRPMPAAARFAVHLLVAAAWAWVLHHEGATGLHAALAFAAVLVGVNVWNFMDGINGLAASQAALLSALLCVALPLPWAALALALVAGCVGFLPSNFPSARIFLGDVGSGALGFCLAALCTVAPEGLQTGDMLVLVPASAFLVDAGLTLVRRVLRGEAWWTPHTQHAYQAWARGLGTHVPVTLGYGLWTAAGATAVTWLADADSIFIWGLCSAWYTSAALLWWSLQRRYGRLQVVPPTGSVGGSDVNGSDRETATR